MLGSPVLDAYNIDINVLDFNPQGQQIIIGDFEELKPYLFFLGAREYF